MIGFFLFFVLLVNITTSKSILRHELFGLASSGDNPRGNKIVFSSDFQVVINIILAIDVANHTM